MSLSINISSNCPACGKTFSTSEVRLEGNLSWVPFSCVCGNVGEITFPTSHQTKFPIVRTAHKSGFQYSYDPLVAWQVAPLKQQKTGLAEFLPVYYSDKKSARVFNCLDSCYGHALLRLLQVYPHLENRECGVVVFIPQALEWMIPNGVSAALVVKGSLSKLAYPLENFDAVATEFLKRYESVSIDSLPLNFDYSTVDIEVFTRVKPFERTSNEKPRITILWRDDRFWVKSKWGEKLASAYYKYRWTLLKEILLHWQNGNYKSLVKNIREFYPELQVTVVGVASDLLHIDWASDKRSSTPDETIEREWCAQYAASELVIGIHGSHMLLPTAMAGAFVELIPDWKIQHLGEDLLYHRSDLERKTLARIVPSRSSISQVSAHAIAILDWWKKLYV